MGTKAAALYVLDIAAGDTARIRLRLTQSDPLSDPLGESFSAVLAKRKAEADEYYARISPYPLSDKGRLVQRQAFAGMLWCKQCYDYVVYRWLAGDPAMPPPPSQRERGRNRTWKHLEADDVMSMPDNWEYPWFALWDTAFHCITLALIDPVFAKRQLDLLTREWYMHPNGHMPAYEWNFNDANPPVHAWAAFRVYKIEQKMFGVTDRMFLERVFQKLLLNFTWWCNRKDAEGNNVFQGGFLGLDNIGPFDRNAVLWTRSRVDQADATSWMGVYCLSMSARGRRDPHVWGALPDRGDRAVRRPVRRGLRVPPLADLGHREHHRVPVGTARPVRLPARPDAAAAEPGLHRARDRRDDRAAPGPGAGLAHARLLRLGQPQRQGHLPALPGLVRRQPGPAVAAPAAGEGQAVRRVHGRRGRGRGQGPSFLYRRRPALGRRGPRSRGVRRPGPRRG